MYATNSYESADQSQQYFSTQPETENSQVYRPLEHPMSVTYSDNPTDDLSSAIKNSECQTIMAALQSTRNRSQAAEMLGISPRTLRHKLQKFREQGIAVTRAYAR